MSNQRRKPQTQAERVLLVAAGLDPGYFRVIRDLPNSIIVEDIRDRTVHIKEKSAFGSRVPQ